MPSLYTEIKTPSHSPSRFWLWVVISILAVLVIAAGILLWWSQHKLSQTRQQLRAQQNDPTVQAHEEAKQLVTAVGKLIILPSNEDPSIATVTDLEKLKGQAFFDQAQVGDKVLIYSQAKKAILYRPSTNQIIELAPLLDSGTPGTPTK